MRWVGLVAAPLAALGAVLCASEFLAGTRLVLWGAPVPAGWATFIVSLAGLLSLLVRRLRTKERQPRPVLVALVVAIVIGGGFQGLNMLTVSSVYRADRPPGATCWAFVTKLGFMETTWRFYSAHGPVSLSQPEPIRPDDDSGRGPDATFTYSAGTYHATIPLGGQEQGTYPIEC